MKNIKFYFLNLILTFMIFNQSHGTYDKIFFDHNINSIEGVNINLNSYKGNIVLLVNTASYCGFTKQFSDLQKLYNDYKSKGLMVIGVPSNSFNQEKNNEKEVKEFCEVNFNINFPMTVISDVKGENAHEIYKWAKKNYGKSAVPKWNFHKILINKDGKVEDTFASFTNPNSNKIRQAIEKLLD